MKYKAEITIMPLEELLDPQGKTIQKNLPNVGIHGVQKVRVGKHVTMELEAENKNIAEELIETASKKLLSNVIMESYTFEVNEIT